MVKPRIWVAASQMYMPDFAEDVLFLIMFPLNNPHLRNLLELYILFSETLQADPNSNINDINGNQPMTF